jgi:serine/threonine protein kinase
MSEYFKEINELIIKIRKTLTGLEKSSFSESSSFKYNNKYSQIYITLFQEGLKAIRWGSKKTTMEESINRIIFKLKTNETFSKFDVNNENKCKILFEIVTKEYPCNIRNLTTMRMHSKNRFEPGVNGLKYKYQGITRFFMPTDGYTKSIMSVNQLLNYLSKQCGISHKTNKISERVDLMRREDIEYTFIESKAYISYKEDIYELERGYPLPIDFSKDILIDKTLKSANWLIKNMNEDGSFLYFYDPYQNTIIDDMHPKMINPLYNNILRHSGGTISLLRAYELDKKEIYLIKAKDSLEFLISTFKEHKYNKEYACFPFFNKKSKLGGAGIGLVALMHYYMHTGDESYRKYIDGLVRHILSRVDKNGELIGYYIHPLFNNGKALINPSDEVKKELFSFYYPGEALLGLALYYLNIKNIDEDLKKDLKIKSEKALDFLVDVRPTKYDYMFEPLPADAWLMQAIEEWVKVENLNKESYIDFVFNDTKKLFEHMYTDKNTLLNNKDYIGGFYYEYGDHVYHDASRCEGIVSAYYLAKYLKDEEKASWIMEHMLLSAKGLMKTFHDEKSVYSHIDSSKSLHSFRFKLTRQWVRVDSVQHASCFFARLIPVFDDRKNHEKVDSFNSKYQIIRLLDNAGYSSVFLGKNKSNNKSIALKKIEQKRYIRLIENEYKNLKIVNDFNSLKFYEIEKKYGEIYFILDYAMDGNLKKYVESNGVLSEENAFEFIGQMLETLSFMVEKRLLHLDFKPANILLYNNKYVLSDWGNSIESNISKSIHLKGNPIYIAPEFYYGERVIPSEIYSLACSVYFVLTKKHVYNLRNRDLLIKKIYSTIYFDVDLSEIKSNKMKYLLSKMLEKDPNKRITLSKLKEEFLKDENDFSSFIYNFKENSDIDFSNEIELYKKMANDDIPFAQNELGRIYIGLNDYKNAFEMFEKSAKKGFPNGQLNFGLMFYNKKYGIVDYKKAFYWIEKAAQEEYDKAQYYMGLFYEKGYYVNKDNKKAIEWFEKSAKNAYLKAYEKLNNNNIKLELVL